MFHRALIATGLALVLALVAVAPAEAAPRPSTWCSNVCGPGVSCSTSCWAQGPLDGNWYWITCTAYDSLFGGGGSCAAGPASADADLERFLRSLESLAEEEAGPAAH
jgi:hypothetical protein